jgi:hypothetical protein
MVSPKKVNTCRQSNPIDLALSRLVAIVAILGIPAGLYGYFSAQHDKRSEVTFQLYKTFRDEPLRRDLNLLMSRWNLKRDQIVELLKQKKYDEITAILLSLMDEKTEEAFDHMDSFFLEVSSCIENRLCDNNAALTLFKDTADDLINAYGPYIIYLREQYSNEQIGTGIYRIRALTKELEWF